MQILISLNVFLKRYYNKNDISKVKKSYLKSMESKIRKFKKLYKIIKIEKK